MRRLELRKSVLAVSIPLAVLGLLAAVPAAERRPPKTRTDDVKDSYGSVQVADPYRWLEDQKAPETRAWIDEQNRYSESYLHDFPGRDAIRWRVGELLKVDTIGVPQEHGGRYFLTERLRRLHRGRRVAHPQRLHESREARDLRRLERRSPGRRRADAAPGSLRRGRLLLPAP